MSAEELRRAASLMRERAEAADDLPPQWWEGMHFLLQERYADHIASWHPAVTLLVADWLDEVAGWREEGLGLMPTTNLADAWGEVERRALAVARLYLNDPT